MPIQTPFFFVNKTEESFNWIPLSFTGVSGPVPAPARDPASIQEGTQLHEGDTCPEIPGGLRPGEGHQGG